MITLEMKQRKAAQFFKNTPQVKQLLKAAMLGYRSIQGLTEEELKEKLLNCPSTRNELYNFYVACIVDSIEKTACEIEVSL